MMEILLLRGYLMQGEIEEDLVTALTNRIAPIEENLNETLANMNETFIRINDVWERIQDKI